MCSKDAHKQLMWTHPPPPRLQQSTWSSKVYSSSNFLFCFLAIPPRVTEEADRMMRKLRDLQTQVDERASDVARKESQLHMLEAEKDSAIKRLRDAEGAIRSW